MSVDTKSISAVTIELSLVDVAVRMVEAALSLGHAVSPVALVIGSISPNLLALAVLDQERCTVQNLSHLPRVNGAIAKLIRFFEFEFRLIQVGDGRPLRLIFVIVSKLRITLLDD